MEDIVSRFEAKYGPAQRAVSDGWGDWCEVWARGDPGFALLNTDEANETGGVSPSTLAKHGWPVGEGTALLDDVPVLDLVGRLGNDGVLVDGIFPENLPSLLVALPASAHLVGRSLGVSWARRADWIYAEVHSVPAEDGPSVSFSVMFCRSADEIVAGIFGNVMPEEVAELFGIPFEEFGIARRETRVYRPW